MKTKGVLFLAVILAVHSATACAANMYPVGTPAMGKAYNEVLHRWFDQSLSLNVSINGDEENLWFIAPTPLGDVSVPITNTQKHREDLESIITTAIAWVDVARKNQADVTKGMACFGRGCELDLPGYQIYFTFFAMQDGKQTNLVVHLIGDDSFHAAKIYLAPPQMHHLLDLIHRVEPAMRAAREAARKQSLFK